MALIKLPEGTQVSGSIGGTTYSHNKFGTYKRSRSIPTNPSSARQSIVRNNMQVAGALWKTLSAETQNTWNSLAALTPFKNKLGDTIYLTGFMLYVSGYTRLVNSGLGIADFNPSYAPPVVPSPQFTMLDLDGGVSLNSNAAWNTGADYGLIIEATPQVSAGATSGSVKNKFKFLKSAKAAIATPYGITNEWQDLYGNQTAGTQVFVRVTMVHLATGIAGVPVIFNNIVP